MREREGWGERERENGEREIEKWRKRERLRKRNCASCVFSLLGVSTWSVVSLTMAVRADRPEWQCTTYLTTEKRGERERERNGEREREK